MVNIDAASDEDAFQVIKNMADIEEFHIVLGAADIIVEIDVRDPNAVQNVIREKMRKIPKVRSTQTITVVK
ncbi:MAG: Lrp/AsnC ligand binding domain-containing protein [Nitrososphaerales archaeon]